MEELTDAQFNPAKNPKVIAIIQQEDGNYKGYTQKFGKVITVRTNDPQTVLLELLTHSGEEPKVYNS